MWGQDLDFLLHKIPSFEAPASQKALADFIVLKMDLGLFPGAGEQTYLIGCRGAEVQLGSAWGHGTPIN